MRIWTPRTKPGESNFTYTLTTRCITDLNYVLMILGHWDCTTSYCMAEKDYQATEVSTSRHGSEQITTKKISCVAGLQD